MFKMLEVIFKIILIYLDIYIYIQYIHIYTIYINIYIYIYTCVSGCVGVSDGYLANSEARMLTQLISGAKGCPLDLPRQSRWFVGGRFFEKTSASASCHLMSPPHTGTIWHLFSSECDRAVRQSPAFSLSFSLSFSWGKKKNAMDHILENPGDPTTPNDQKWRKNSKRTTIVGLWDALCIHCEIVNSCFLVILAEWDSCSKIFMNDRSLSPCLCPFSPPRSCGKMWMISSKSTSAELGFLRGLKFKIEVRNGPEDFLPRLARRSSLLQPLLLVLLVFVFPLAIWLVNWDHHHLSHWINQGMDKLKAVEDLNATNKHQQTFTSFSA